MNPFDLPGPAFLILYIIVMAVACCLAYFLRQKAARGDRGFDPRESSLDAYEAAYLSGGAKLATATAIATLVRSKALRLSFVDNTLSSIANLPRNSHPFERAVHSVVASGEARTIESIRTKTESAADQIAARLKALGLIISDQQTTTAHNLPVIIMMTNLLFGVIKIFIGLSRGRAVGFLFVLCLLTAFIAFRLYKSPPFRTQLGDRTLERLQSLNAALQTTAKAQPQRLATGDVSMAMALFGMGAIAFEDQSWSVLRKQMFPPPSVSSGSSSGSSSSCSSSSCSSSSCGGGCGGGGCGGCGS